MAEFHENNYRKYGLAAQRRYPNEELVRFLARTFGQRPDKNSISILEVGSGTGANLWMMAQEGYGIAGVDISPTAVELCRQELARRGLDGDIRAANMTALPWEKESFDAVVDVFSAYCLDEKQFSKFLDESARVLKKGGWFFAFTPSKESDAFTDHAPATLVDASTLNGIYRETSPYSGNHYPFRFTTTAELGAALTARGFTIVTQERVTRSYRDGQETFAFVVLSAEKTA